MLLAGIVFFNVDVLELNHGIASTDVRATQLERQNAALTQQLARLASSERIQTLAIQRGFVLPQPGDVGYLRATPKDATRAARTMTGPQATPTAAPTLVTQSSAPSTTPTTPTTTPAPSSQLPAQAAASPAQPATP